MTRERSMVSTTQPSQGSGDLVERLLTIMREENTPTIRTLVGHVRPDDDVWLCCWMAMKFIKKAARAQIVFVRAGETLPGSEGNPSVLHFDTGGGEYDQHGRRLKRACSAMLLAQGLGLSENPGLKLLLEMVTAVDNAEAVSPISTHFLIEGYPHHQHAQTEKGINWAWVQERVFEDFDILYEQELRRHEGRAKLASFVQWRNLPNGLQIAILVGHPELRDAAYEAGAAVVVWTNHRGPLGPRLFSAGIQRTRRFPELGLNSVAAALRANEATMRRIDIANQRLDLIGESPLGWFLHESRAVILNGSKTHPLIKEEEHTKLSPMRIADVVCSSLATIPPGLVKEWKQKFALG